MKLTSTLTGAALALCTALPAFAADVTARISLQLPLKATLGRTF